jgi:hypothetical protein
MRIHSLGPHSYPSPLPHENHHQWLSSFTSEERRHLIEEDQEARNGAFTVLISCMGFGLSTLIIAVIMMASRG